MPHGELEAAGRIAVVEVVDRQSLGEGDRAVGGGERDHRGQGVDHVVAADLIRAVGQARLMARASRGQQQGRSVGRARGEDHDVAAPGFFAVCGLADDPRHRPTPAVGLKPDCLPTGKQGDIRGPEQRFDRDRPGVALGAQ